MSPYFIALWQLIWTWVIAPPEHWALSLSREWQWELGVAALAFVFRRRIIEHSLIGVELVREWREERARQSEWYHYGAMEDAEFQRVVESLRDRAAKEEELAERLKSRAGSRFNLRMVRDAAWRREQCAAALYQEADRLELLRERIELERARNNGGDDDVTGRDEVLDLMRKLDSGGDRTAMRALAELNRIWSTFEWERLTFTAPKDVKRRVVTLLRIMASTTHVPEAQNALRTAMQILKQSNCDWWQWERETA